MLFVTVLFSVIEILVAGGWLPLKTELLPPNLQTQGHWYDNPVVWVIALTIIVNFAGYIENVVIAHQAYDVNKFLETYFKYLPMLVIFTQFLPTTESASVAFALDYLSRALKTR